MKIFFLSLVNILLVGLVDALLKGNLMAYYGWERLPWYFKDVNFVYPAFIFLVFLASGFLFIKLFKLPKIYWLFLAVWGFFGLESLGYWFWIDSLKINQTRIWLPDSSFFGFYPPEAPWLKTFFPHLRFLSGGETITRGGLLLGTLIALTINLFLSWYFYFKRKIKETIR